MVGVRVPMQGVARHGCIMILTALLDAHAARRRARRRVGDRAKVIIVLVSNAVIQGSPEGLRGIFYCVKRREWWVGRRWCTLHASARMK